jgi:hypothetical protein
MDPRYVFYIIGTILAVSFGTIITLVKIEERREKREKMQQK